MSDLKLEILKAIQDKSNPYCDITTLKPEHDIYSEDFTASFTQLRGDGLIRSNHTDCGLTITPDGMTAWTVSNLYITEKGKLLLSPPKPKKESVVSWLIKPVILASVIALVYWITPQIYGHYNKADNPAKEIFQKKHL
jgi:hypothetical protein